MLDFLASQTGKFAESAVIFASGVVGIVGSAMLATGSSPDGWMGVFEKGGFLLLTLFAIGFFLWMILPKIINSVPGPETSAMGLNA
jgi:hypothetical protein